MYVFFNVVIEKEILFMVSALLVTSHWIPFDSEAWSLKECTICVGQFINFNGNN